MSLMSSGEIYPNWDGAGPGLAPAGAPELSDHRADVCWIALSHSGALPAILLTTGCGGMMFAIALSLLLLVPLQWCNTNYVVS